MVMSESDIFLLLCETVAFIDRFWILENDGEEKISHGACVFFSENLQSGRAFTLFAFTHWKSYI